MADLTKDQLDELESTPYLGNYGGLEVFDAIKMARRTLAAEAERDELAAKLAGALIVFAEQNPGATLPLENALLKVGGGVLAELRQLRLANVKILEEDGSCAHPGCDNAINMYCNDHY